MMTEAPITILHISITDWLMITAVLFSPWIALFILRESLFKMFTGELTLPISVNSLPVSEENMNNQKKFIELATKYLEKQLSDAGALEIKQEIP